MRVVSRRQSPHSVQRPCATDCKRPCLAGRQSPSHTAPFLGEGVWGFGKDAEIERTKALQDAKPTKRSYRDREFALSYKKQTFSANSAIASSCAKSQKCNLKTWLFLTKNQTRLFQTFLWIWCIIKISLRLKWQRKVYIMAALQCK